MATVVQYPARSGRNSELTLTLLAIALGVGGYLSVMAFHPEAPALWYWHCAGIAFSGLILHLALRILAPFADPVIMPIALALNGIGLAMISRLDLEYMRMNTPASLAQISGDKQLIMTLVAAGGALTILVCFRDHRFFRKFAWAGLVLGILLMMATLIPGLGVKSYGAYISIRILGQSIQPNEFAKLCLAIFFAGYLEYRRDSLAIAGKKILFLQLPRWRDFLPLLVAWLASLALLVAQKDLGVALLMFTIFVAVLYVATDRPSWIIFGALLMVPLAVLAYTMFSHVKERVSNWLDAFNPAVIDRPGGSYQLVNGLFGIASGGLSGNGWGRGQAWRTALANSDFIVSALTEELGLTGMLAIFLLYLILVQRGLRTAMGVRDGFGKLLATAISFGIGAQLFIVVGGITRLIPSTGLTTPFVAAGGASLFANWIGIAILLRISDSARRPRPAPVTLDAKSQPGQNNGTSGTNSAVEAILGAPTEVVNR
ncbi:cell cycle protein, FtsW/RodA/SpoVE family [Mobiluncus mulieris 28-1]|uniref:Cell division protein FtsW n=1 Tax=Mobiluncus mulieris TaxID=2052 RepID=A0A8G2HT89_9ACTO|nr:FtsW/RodA/SpoVE family cell cycle protein [Mobiluncus mulieris]EEZ92395.1 cell cycle protein, FtsW/RodA/SpoVE family [Mobiluncus mulieris 28-1]MBB5847311.1 cell division protein FtsW (lipid II flippase) [Mobiluncus mulieris]MCU9993963.1 FtsW/RodA/SpoVE family cell cycle protein [Mobiluncus mulieris]MCV0011442.1 FtsW/RodA/SpoVE family cell cycle protein [Mobiluncus mulieris]STO16243.1 Cell division protein FtsW [Mobiluncus mulieris]